MCIEPPPFDPENQSPTEALMNAIIHGNVEGVKMMLDAGAAVDGADNENIPLLSAARQPGEAGEKIVRLLIDRGANVNSTDKYGFTALMHAAQDSMVPAVRLLLDSGADITLRDGHSRRTAQEWAECTAGFFSGDAPEGQDEGFRILKAESDATLKLLKEAEARVQHKTAVERQAVLKGHKPPTIKF